jgi:transcriptional/translational regulatory protein YebC/TACO1
MTPVNYLFHRHGCVLVSLEQGLDFDSPAVSKFIDFASDQGAIDFEEAPTSSAEHQQYLFYCPPQQLAPFEATLSTFGSGIKVASAEIAYIPTDRTQSVEDEVEQEVKELVQDLEENDDTLRVWTTLDFTSPEQ